jgi:hypothetical protein
MRCLLRKLLVEGWLGAGTGAYCCCEDEVESVLGLASRGMKWWRKARYDDSRP